ncbi:MAG TPA: AbrB/MazE/SpoVT family DNA-binding domain-containing protein [Candidatus Limnocylindria bacterium]|nr:AbrB/MazE/SpoVT family DNA-binding domain-containing protein [Candidatus Limnocylindria bacterium]
MPRTLVAMNAQGRVTLPADIRRRLGLGAGDQLEVALDDDGIRLRPARVLLAEDAWAYTAENISGIRKALDDIREGRVFRMTYEDLDKVVASGELPRHARRSATRRRR